MNPYYLPDITGVNPDYAQYNMPFFIYEPGIQITFENSPVFASSLRIAKVDGSGELLIKDVDWRVMPADIDQTAMSRAFLENNQFADKLVKSVTIISNKAVGKAVAMSFQEYYLTTPGRTFDDGTPFEVTPDLIKAMATGLAEMRQQVARVTSPITPIDHTPTLMKFDINCEFSENVVVDEVIAVNTIAGAKVIRLTQGAFFADSLTLSYNGVALSKDTDYLCIGFSPLTKQSTNKSGIYQYILLNSTISGQVKAGYHALGGDVQVDDMKAVLELMLAIKTYLNNGVFVTADSISETPAFRALHARFRFLEDNMRVLLSGAPTYGDSTAGSSVRRAVTTPDANIHWWTIASLYQVNGSPDIITTDQFKARVFFPGAKVALTFTADVNLNQARQPVTFKTESLVFDPLYTLFGDTSVASPVYPMVRVCWNKNGSTFSGAVVQIGLPLTALSDQMVVEDLSTTESCWILNKATDPAPKDNGFVLPDGSSTWSAVSATSLVRQHVPTYTPGYLVYTGSTVPLSQLTGTASTASKFNVVLPTYFPIANIQTLIVTMASPDTGTVYDIEIPLPLAGTGTKQGRATFIDSSNEAVAMKALVSQTTQGVVTVSLNVANLTTGAANSLADLVRYIRAKV